MTKIPCPYCDALINVSKDGITGIYCGKKEDHYSSKCTECGKPFYLETDSDSYSGSEKSEDSPAETTIVETTDFDSGSEKSEDSRSKKTTYETDEAYGASSNEEYSYTVFGWVAVGFGFVLFILGLRIGYELVTYDPGVAQRLGQALGVSSGPTIGDAVIPLVLLIFGLGIMDYGHSLLDED
jgi:hypothetical protein